MIGPRRGWSRWSDGGHLSLDAVVALVDGELADGPAHRARAHVDHCLRCAAEVTAQRQARRRLRGAQLPGAPSTLLSSLRAIPSSADLPPTPTTLAVDAEGQLVERADEHHQDQHHQDQHHQDQHRQDGHHQDGHHHDEPPAGTDAEPAAGPRRRTRRRLTVGIPAAVASGLAVGAVTLAGPTPTPAPAAGPPLGTARPAVAPTRANGTPSVVGAELSLRRTTPAGPPGPGLP